MGVAINTIYLSELAFDEKIGIKDYSILNIKGLRIKELLKNKNLRIDIKSGRTPSRFKESYWGGEDEFLTMQDVDLIDYSLNRTCTDKITELAINEDKSLYKAPENALLISNAMTVGLALITDRPVYINQNIFHVDIDEEIYNKKFLKWYFNLVLKPAFDLLFASKYLSKGEISRIKVPQIDISILNKNASKIELIEEEIHKLKSEIQDPSEVINNVFIEEFDLDNLAFEELKNEFKYSIYLNDFANNVDMRCSFKFHRKAGEFVDHSLNDITSKKLKYFLAKPITLGKGISPKHYDTEGIQYYISMADIKNWKFDSNNAKKVSETFFSKNYEKTVNKNDILMARSGEGTIGKVALIDTAVDAIYADFTMRIKLENYNSLFAYYYFRTEFFQYLVYINKKGLGNNTNIFPSQVREFPLIDIPITEQQRIVKKIKLELDKQKELKEKIENKKKEISLIIEEIEQLPDH